MPLSVSLTLIPEIFGLIFCRTRIDTQRIAENLMKDGYNADALHGDLNQAQRDRVMMKFRQKSVTDTGGNRCGCPGY
jgi:ATP-dependent RNA helicase DeaD